jgi:hypothetical protein
MVSSDLVTDKYLTIRKYPLLPGLGVTSNPIYSKLLNWDFVRTPHKKRGGLGGKAKS